MNILKEAESIVFERTQEKERMYGPFTEGMDRAASIAKGMTGKDITASDVYDILVALKLSRDSYNKKKDNILDAVAYLAAKTNHYKQEYKIEEHEENTERSSS